MGREAYLESGVLTASPARLICILYERAVASVQEARRELKLGNIAARSKAICHAIDVVSELDASLDHDAGGQISASLAELYGYVRRRLTEGNMRQSDAPLAEVESLLTILAEGWSTVPQAAIDGPSAMPKQFENPACREPAHVCEHTWQA